MQSYKLKNLPFFQEARAALKKKCECPHCTCDCEHCKNKIKLLGKGVIKVKIDIEVSAFSRSAKENIEKIGGSVVILDDKKKSLKQDKKSGV